MVEDIVDICPDYDCNWGIVRIREDPSSKSMYESLCISFPDLEYRRGGLGLVGLELPDLRCLRLLGFKLPDVGYTSR